MRAERVTLHGVIGNGSQNKVLDTSYNEAVSNAAEEIANRRYGLAFKELPKHLSFRVWEEAEAEVEDMAVELSHESGAM